MDHVLGYCSEKCRVFVGVGKFGAYDAVYLIETNFFYPPREAVYVRYAALLPLDRVNVAAFDAVNVLRVHEVHERFNFQAENSGYEIVSIFLLFVPEGVRS